MKAMVLAAGQGTRLRPITDAMPKALVPLAGRPMIEYALLLLGHYGIREIVINLHHFGAQIESHLGDGHKLGLRISYSHEAQLLDTGGGLLKAKAFLQDGTFIVINTDALIDLNLGELIAFHRSRNSTATLVLRPDPEADRYGSMDIDGAGRIHRFLDSRSALVPSGELNKLMFTGVQVLEPKIFTYMPSQSAGEKFSTTRQTYPQMLLSGEPLYGYCFDGFWQDLGTVERIKQVEANLAQGRATLHYLT
ncbi:MAG: nucleotidyltransferase family protein [Deltaproteobacteria bacterium]|nr:nucleotidyltransferase family protein [Deltaproteobacteria bacterium]